ncbi:PfkB family carbohydrate kinase [Antarcticirhabdus aurantiaca]|uniref:PfkB family carbohydrate kinase n=1 Tax=Antarcticirhabdus aurantiaca TaxID=2606717 RepID=A0ACD4NPU4_9HYPH|nr:PfkB family carbohydrate kinase [Antarcticirhabdus aurantiaca]WAJ28852.1 PfkB family carbohydrate kinase [Jeongeuplla avenae]
MTLHQPPVIVVVGSLHYDIMVDAPDRPRKGETVTGHAWVPKFGGKGGNQAVAAARAGAHVRMAGAVGDDAFGRFLRAALEDGGVDATHVETLAGTGSGMSVAISDAGGDYGAVIVSGANIAIDPGRVAAADLWAGASALILQNEVPDAVNVAAARAAKAAGALVCLNAAPYRPLSDDLAGLLDVLVVNAIEAEQFGSRGVAGLDDARAAAEALAARFPVVVVTAGGDGVAGVKRGEPTVTLRARPVTLVSTHGAGDVFVGALVAALTFGKPFDESLSDANEAAGRHVSTTKSAAL